MAATVEQLQQWIECLPPTWVCFVDEDGLTIRARSAENPDKAKVGNGVYYELGGEPNEKDDDA
jgi:hypothetical protein